MGSCDPVVRAVVSDTNGESYAKPRVSLTVPKHNHLAQVSLTVSGTVLGAIAKAKKLIWYPIAQDLVQD